jgi:hypothetical protein
MALDTKPESGHNKDFPTQQFEKALGLSQCFGMMAKVGPAQVTQNSQVLIGIGFFLQI